MTGHDPTGSGHGSPPRRAVLDTPAVLAWLRAEPGSDVVETYLAAAKLWPAARPTGLSLGDRCCLAPAARLGGPAVTADSAWTGLDLGVSVVSIR
ncbi:MULTISPECIES: hypothetical protein [unclassified Pseudonocardia]|uniref:hypothetical protein n=1 Tax=unclassified Pseudonocardia TaxID=2619320 RepID=UPI00094AC9E7|nr:MULTISPECIES: hypothetical protein [unclassified Pseudonocardia]